MANGIIVRTRGPFFDGRRDRIVKQVAHEMVKELVELGEAQLANWELLPQPLGAFLSVEQAQKGHASVGNARRNLNAFVRGAFGRLDLGNLVYGPWLEGTSNRNQTTRFKGYFMFRRTAQWLRRKAKRVARKHVERMVRQLNGGF